MEREMREVKLMFDGKFVGYTFVEPHTTIVKVPVPCSDTNKFTSLIYKKDDLNEDEFNFIEVEL